MILDKYPKSLLEAVAIHEFLGRLGYSKTTEMSLAFRREDVAVLLKADGKRGQLRIGIAELPRDEMITKWQELVAEYNACVTMTEEDKENIFLSSDVYANMELTLRALSAAGFRRFLVPMGADLN